MTVAVFRLTGAGKPLLFGVKFVEDREQKKLKQELATRCRLLEAWYGRDRATVEMTAHTPGPVSIGEAVGKVCSSLADPEVGYYAELDAHWTKIVGTQLALFVRPGRFLNGVLELEVRHSALIRELTPSLDLIQKRVDKHLGGGVCREVRLVPAGGARPGRR